MKFINNISDKYSARISVSGGKGANLNTLVRNRFNVPHGIIVNTNAFTEFLTRNNLWPTIKNELQKVRVNDYSTISNASRNIRNAIQHGIMPVEIASQLKEPMALLKTKRFAVRSSGVFEDSFDNSWAGQFDSYLNIRKDLVLERIKSCWASFFSVRAISYNSRAYKNLNNMRFAVVVQKMVASEKSGVAFSIDPRTNDTKKIFIEATHGLGENLVSGKKLDFTAVIEKKNKIILDRIWDIGKNDTLLSEREIVSLGDKVSKLEKLFKKPVDIEWAIAKGNIYLLQIRPITNINTPENSVKKESELPDIDNYELTFKVSGLSFLFTDVLARGFKYLDPLFTSNEQAQFLQYFTNEKMEYAAKSGMTMFSSKGGFREYLDRFTSFYNKNTVLLEDIITREHLTKSAANQFFKTLSRLFTYYSKMDNQFTNLAYIYSNQNKLVRRNLHLLSGFKDSARVWINTASIEDSSQLSRLLNRICEEFDLARADLECYKVEELLQLFYGIFVPQKEIDKRKISFTIYRLKNKFHYLVGSKSTELIRKFSERQNLFSTAEIKGKVANKVQKVVKGEVRIITVDYGNLEQMNREIEAMNKGEILVAEFTAPELIAACRKAKAIVTDIGGLLSHAAIVSRELGIPCLVGTGNATKKLKTGDNILIDFELGTISKSQPS